MARRMLLVTYDVAPLKTDIHTKIASTLQNSGNWWHYMTSTWLLDTEKTADELGRTLSVFMTPADRLLVIEVTRHHQGWLEQKAWEWINKWWQTYYPQG